MSKKSYALLLKEIWMLLKLVARVIWSALESPRLQNILALASLLVTIYLTLYIFELTNRQEESTVEVSIDSIPTNSTPEGHLWDIFIHIHNSGPADIQTSTFIVQVPTESNAVRLVGFESRDFLSVIREPSWKDPSPTPYVSEQGLYAIPIENLERDDNFIVRMVFSVNDENHQELEALWRRVGIQEVVDPQDGSISYDKTSINRSRYASLLKNFLKSISLSGENVSTEGDMTYLRP